MIRIYGKKMTPKRFAAEMSRLNIDNSSYWQESADLKGMTEVEIEKINAQMDKLQKRFMKIIDRILEGT